MRDIQRFTLPVCVAMLSFAAPQPSAAAYQFYMDSFVIAKAFPNGTTDPLVAFSAPYIKFLDEFDAGGAPPDLAGVFNSDQNNSGTPDFSYSSNPATDGTVGPEVAYQGAQYLLSLSSDNAVVYAGAGGNLSLHQYVAVNAEDGTGLGRTARFGVAGVFQWIVPDLNQSYGIQLQDRRSSVPGDDIINLRVRGLGAGLAEVQMRRIVYDDSNGFTVGTHVLASTALAPPSGASFIALSLLHPSADTDQLYGGWMFLDADFGLLAGSVDQFDDPVNIFHGETTGYRAAFTAAEPVPEAQTWAMLLAGLSLVGWVSRRRP